MRGAIPAHVSCILPGVISVVVPAHDEARVIGRLLGQLTSGAPAEGLEVIVVANGCTDDTAQVAGRYGPGVRVLSIPVPSKREALLAGDQAATGFPRIYVDADVELGSADIRALAGAWPGPARCAAGPERVLALSGRLVAGPLVLRRLGAAARGTQRAVRARGHRAQRGWSCAGRQPAAAARRRPRRVPGLRAGRAGHRARRPGRRARPADRRRPAPPPGPRRHGREPGRGGRGRPRRLGPDPAPGLLALVRAQPWLAPRVAVFLAVAVAARRRAAREVRRNQYSTWLRDESSRA